MKYLKVFASLFLAVQIACLTAAVYFHMWPWVAFNFIFVGLGIFNVYTAGKLNS